MTRAQTLARILELVHNSPRKACNPLHIAILAGYSRSYLDRLFLQSTGESLGRYIRAWHLSDAAFRVACTDDALRDIAQDYFTSHEAFTRAFQRAFGVSPSAYRRSKRSGVVRKSLYIRICGCHQNRLRVVTIWERRTRD